MWENDLLAPSRVGSPRGPRSHNRAIILPYLALEPAPHQTRWACSDIGLARVQAKTADCRGGRAAVLANLERQGQERPDHFDLNRM